MRDWNSIFWVGGEASLADAAVMCCCGRGGVVVVYQVVLYREGREGRGKGCGLH